MNSDSGLGRQLADLVTFILLPLLCVVLPYSAGQRVIRTVAARGWLLRARAAKAMEAARAHLPIEDEQKWKMYWRMVELSDARDMWYSLLGRQGSLVRSVQHRNVPAQDNALVMIGFHWGNGLRALMSFQQLGLKPRLVYRAVGRDILKAAPFNYLYLKLLVRCIRKVCAGKPIEVPGGRRAFEAALGEEGAPVIVLDAPALHEASSIKSEVLGQVVLFNRNGARLLAENETRCSFFALGLDSTEQMVLHCEDPFSPSSADELMMEYGHYLTKLLRQDSSQWRLWHVAEQLFRPAP